MKKIIVDEKVQQFLAHKAYNMRVSSLIMTSTAKSGHPTSALSAADIVSVLFFYAMRFDPFNPNNPNNDRFILSKGHASPLLYAVWKELGVLTEKELLTYRAFNSVLEGHPTPRFSHTEAATGSLGQGLSIGAGMALVAKMDQRPFRTYVLIGDAESSEGSVWEAAEIAAFYQLHNLIGILDCNRLGQSTAGLHEHDVNRYAAKFDSFGWQTYIANGHDIVELINVFDLILHEKHAKPIMIIAKTLKGYGVQKAEDQQGFHGKAFDQKELLEILENMKAQFPSAAQYTETYDWKPQFPATTNEQLKSNQKITLEKPPYQTDERIATRKAYGQALAALGDVSSNIVSLDGEVKNSTYAEIFEKKHPERFVQCFVAEQNMIGMAVGMAKRGKIPFASTFGAFMSRAFDQIRMAAIGKAPLRLCGSHAGISIGEDGPSQMGLEDVACMRTVPHSVVLYPSDAISTYKLVECMANYHEGISYLRTTRMETPILYTPDEEFSIGGCKVLRQSDHDVALVIGAGITVHEALKAYAELQKENIAIAIIDLYCVKPLAHETILRIARKAHNRIITVEDHYQAGGIGEAVAFALRNTGMHFESLAVKKLPQSGKPAALMAWEEIDASAIVQMVKKFILL